MVGSGLAKSIEVVASTFALGNPFLGKFARLNFLEDLLHHLLGRRGHNAWSTGHVAVLSGVTDAVTHTSDALFVHEVNNELHFVQALEVRHLGLVTSFDERFESGLHQ